MIAIRSFGRRGGYRVLGEPTDLPSWCEPGQPLPCLCETSGQTTPGCTPAPSCDAPGAVPGACIFPEPTAWNAFGPLIPFLVGGAALGAASGYAWKRSIPAAGVGAGIGAVGGPILAVVGAVLISGRVG